MSTSQYCCCQCLCPHTESWPPPASAGDPPILTDSSGPISYGLTSFFLWILVYVRLCVHPPRVEFLFLPVPWMSCDQTQLAFKARFSGDSSSPRLGSLMWGSELSLLWDNFCGIIVFQFVGCPPGWYGI